MSIISTWYQYKIWVCLFLFWFSFRFWVLSLWFGDFIIVVGFPFSLKCITRHYVFIIILKEEGLLRLMAWWFSLKLKDSLYASIWKLMEKWVYGRKGMLTSLKTKQNVTEKGQAYPSKKTHFWSVPKSRYSVLGPLTH